MFKIAETIRNEYCLKITGKVRARPAGSTNPNIASGEVEILCHEIEVLNPFLKVGGEKLEKIGVEKKTVSAKLISTIIEYISGIEVFKSFGVIGDKFERLEKGFRDLKKYSIKLELTAVPYVLLFQVIIDLLFPILLLLTIRFFINGEIFQRFL